MILCITHSGDYYNVDLFFAYLKSKGIPFFRLNSDHLNHLQKISIGQDSFELTDEDGNTVHSDDIKGVWNRKTWGVQAPEEMEEEYRPVFINEYRNLTYNLITSLEHLPWINPYESERKTDGNKMYQLRVAQKNQLNVPETLFSNDAEKITSFFYRCCNGKAVAKLHGVMSKSMTGEQMLSTMIIEEDSLDSIEDIAYCPMIFQPYIEKEYELRIVYVDGIFFTGKINNADHADWRVANSNYFWSAYTLPENICQNLTAMMRELVLCLGAIDMIRGKDGNYYFLEVNPQGEWGMLQKELDFPIAETIADYLIKRINIHE
ncbi:MULTISPECIES: MvdC/MvdD family ATP grasp protein [Chryseobacterium]|uniref:Glutathione synthase/RimK-type ligase-like ATP-grasp enzyme n=1 Tax=Chryseobacterium camelliae TaxID=1265445 RepID=A0ABU0TIZ7_9FLAO|nr:MULTISPECIES: ATP-grasp ribosomal peptide maturase [Chryseobacterium]MDT3409124.1 glutathione synthase/RimK-type ligase-like ATP-grasp enzyme [Pseudacidovorax intermedius]MDQ1097018.1 glutathione synthase/RimK-type ligase-like ATP-grasp enzyme [Chryseobacterium camelliae]MDQ1100957.1 glutathione synthase/RimK-type ligase-like ATP-grasp enzyme [Chryseobacterium sp. SORGH_AS_1048]MDR6084399.1 glutathione synthase/RimK-type ligase-like ATP-grasp enzyme [Chryseobacterium sp. SORGH_AS_0909]MDR61